ncbi:MAG: hypothetical protein H6597_01315 [Flavobacteriales bacterium]|nr:hypothetical protein [Flavobacteriales bacterium]
MHAADEGWLVQNGSVFTPYTERPTETINGRLSIEPLKSLVHQTPLRQLTYSGEPQFVHPLTTPPTPITEKPARVRHFPSVSIITRQRLFSQTTITS